MEHEYTTDNMEANLILMRALNEIYFMERMKILMPAVAEELIRMGVKFPARTEAAGKNREG